MGKSESFYQLFWETNFINISWGNLLSFYWIVHVCVCACACVICVIRGRKSIDRFVLWQLTFDGFSMIIGKAPTKLYYRQSNNENHPKESMETKIGKMRREKKSPNVEFRQFTASVSENQFSDYRWDFSAIKSQQVIIIIDHS